MHTHLTKFQSLNNIILDFSTFQGFINASIIQTHCQSFVLHRENRSVHTRPNGVLNNTRVLNHVLITV